MELPPGDGGLDLGDAPLLPDGVPDEGQELPVLPDDDILGAVFGDHFADLVWLERNLMDITVEDSSDHALIPILPADDVGWMDICEVCEAVPLPGNLVRPTCTCRHKCVERVTQGGRTLSAPSEGRGSRQELLAGVGEARPLAHREPKSQGAQPRVEACRTQCLL